MSEILNHVKTGDLKVGDVVLTHGMRCRINDIERIADKTSYESQLWACDATVLNAAEVLEQGIVPSSFLFDNERYVKGPGHGREDCWNVQGNNLATWTVERETPGCTRDLSWWAVSELDDTCRQCGRPVREHREHRDVHGCTWAAETTNTEAAEAEVTTDSGFGPGQPYFEICAARGPDAFSGKRNPTCASQGTAEHNAREYSRDGRAYVVEHIDAAGNRSKVSEFRNGRKIRQA